MTILFHPEFAKDVRKFESEYARVSPRLGNRFRIDVDDVIQRIKSSPSGAGHFLNLGSSKIISDLRRCNLKSFPFFILYGLSSERLLFGAVIPSRSDPLTWLTRFRK